MFKPDDMKQRIIISLLFLLTSCSKKQTYSAAIGTDLTVIQDITDTFLIRPSVEPIMALYNFKENKDRAAKFKITLLTDRLLNPTESMNLADDATTEKDNKMDDVYFREKMILWFHDMLGKTLSDFQRKFTPCSPMGNSEVFATISCELNELAQGTAQHKILLVYSDLQEHGSIFNCYSPQGQRLLQDNPDKVAALLNAKRPLPKDMRGITVFLVYQPKDRISDQRFDSMQKLYVRLLTRYGAQVIIQSNGSHFEL